MTISESYSQRAIRISVPTGKLPTAASTSRVFGGDNLGSLEDVTLGGLTLRGKKLKAVIEELISDAKMVRTIEGASTVVITINDYQRTITKSALATEASELTIEGMKFVLVKVRKTGNNLQMTFEDWAVTELRKKTGAKKANRDTTTRAQFAEMLVKEIKGLKFYSPEKNVKQDVYPYDTHNVRVEENTPTVSGSGGGEGGGGGGGGSGTRERFASDLLTMLNYPKSASNYDALVAWMSAESGGHGVRARFNPMCTTQTMPGSTPYNDNAGNPVKNYPDWDTGVKATHKTITNGHPTYAPILAALQAGDNAMAVCVAVDASEWGTDHSADHLDDIQADRTNSYRWTVYGATENPPRNVRDGNPGDNGTNQNDDAAEGQEPGFDPNTTFTIQGDKATNQQIGNVGRILRKADAMGVNKVVQQAAVLAAITDSGAYNLPVADSPARDEDVESYTPRAGIFQYRISQYPQIEQWTIAMQAEKFLSKAKYFYNTYLDTHGEVRVLHRLANDVTRRDMVDFDHYGERYKEWAEEARNIVQLFYHERVAYGEGESTDSYNQADYNLETNLSAQATVVVEPYEFSRGTPEEPEDSWTCLQRLADEVDWRCFSVNGTIYFVRDKVLLKNKALDTITEFQQTVDYIDFDYDVGKPLSSIDVEIRAERWAVPPGAIVVIKDLGPATGRYIVQEFTRGMHSDRAKITLVGERPQLKEPAPDTHVESIDPDGPGSPTTGGGPGGEGGGIAISNQAWDDSLMDGANRVARWALSKCPRAANTPSPHRSYVWGGRHVSFEQLLATPNHDDGWDCSGFTADAWSKVGVDMVGTTDAQWDKCVNLNLPRGGSSVNGVGCPPNGWKPGDLIWPDADQHHIILATGNGTQTCEAQCTACGMKITNRATSSVPYWARPAQLIPARFRTTTGGEVDPRTRTD